MSARDMTGERFGLVVVLSRNTTTLDRRAIHWLQKLQPRLGERFAAIATELGADGIERRTES